MPFFVYILKSEKTGKSYVGHTHDIAKRLSEHNSGKSKSTKGKGPWDLVHHEEFGTRGEAVQREKFFKTVGGRIELKNKDIL